MSSTVNRLQRPWVVCLLAMLCCFFWGSAFPGVKIGYQLFQIAASDTAQQILFAGVRFTLAGVLVILLGSVGARRLLVPKRPSWGMVSVLSLFQTVIQYLLFYIGMAHTAGVKGSIIEASASFLAILFASFLFRQECFTAGKAAGCLLGFAGVVLVNLTGGGFAGGLSFIGEGFVLLSAASSALSSALMKNYSRREDPITLSGYQFLLGGGVMIAVGLLLGGRIRFGGWEQYLITAYLGLASAAAYSVWSILLKHNPVSRVAVFGFMTPVFGVILSAVLLGEAGQLPWLQCVLALVLVSAGIWIVNRAPAPGRRG